MGAILRLCVSSVISVALRPFSYNIHGHDLVVEACWCSSLDRRVDIEILALKLEENLKAFNRKPLWELLGSEEAMVEDLLLELARRLNGVEGLSLCSIAARWSGRSITLSF